MTKMAKRGIAQNVAAKTRRMGLVAVLATAGTIGTAQNFAFSNFDINGNLRVEDGTILTFAGIDSGQTLSAGDLNEATQRIRESGLFESVTITPRGTTLVIDVVEFPTINQISIEGNARLRDAQLLPLVTSQPRRVFNPAQAERDTAAITEAYASQGRINATVTPRLIRRTDNRVDLVFEVVEAGVTEIERISFVGNRSFSEGRLRRVLDTKEAGLLRGIISRDTYSPERIERDKMLLTDFYRSRGYPDFVVQNVDVALTRERDAYLVTFNVQEGQQFEFGNVVVVSEVNGINAGDFQPLIRSRAGETYSPVPIESDLASIERLALQKGIQFMAVEPRITRDDRDLTLDVTYALVPGPRVFIERINVAGNGTTLDRVIRNQFNSVEGDPFNPNELRASAQRIQRLGFFANADVNARAGTDENQVILDVDVTEAPTGTLSFGANYNGDTGVGLIASYAQTNFGGRGQRLSFDISTTQSNRRLAFGFAEPQLLGRDLRFGLDASYRITDNENATYDTEAIRFSPSLGFPVSDNGRLSIFYAYESTDLFDSTSSSVIINNEVALGQVVNHSVGYTYSYDTRRTALDPNTGVLFRFGQEYGFGDSEFIKTTALVGGETKVLNEEVTLRATVEGGYLSYSDGSSRVTDRFFLNSRTMRGFAPGGIGPRDDASDDALGGNAFAVARLEAEFPLGLPTEYGITGGVFLDYGSVWEVGETFGEDVIYNDAVPRAIVGAAIFWDTPIGPLRFNFTQDLDVQDRDETRSFDVTISTSF